MSSWIPSLFNSPSDDDNPTSPSPRSPSSGVKEDLSAVFRGIVEARETLLKKLQNKTEEASENRESSSDSDEESTSQNKDASETAVNTTKSGHQSEEEVGTSTSVDAPKQSENEDVSFSDLEDDENDLSGVKGSKHDKVTRGGAHEWVQLNEASAMKQRRDKESEGEESPNDWLTVDDADFDSLAEV
ncbi:hypothetical protein ACJIZ3_025343 [Penstemon smallii]|uniref:BSD domain-containing protein n=1 Tax=Penstemon smallii TaxID=265156 RepID=A0ABD3TUI7_9LAMI